MTQLGYALSSEEHPPLELVRQAERAERRGFTFALISDHYHPWIDRQGQSGFVWSVLGGRSPLRATAAVRSVREERCHRGGDRVGGDRMSRRRPVAVFREVEAPRV